MINENILNYYYNIGGFNNPQLIGYIMNMIRKIKPLTINEWKIWYLENIHDENYIKNIAIEMHKSIPDQYKITFNECESYIYDVMFRRTFQGYNKEKNALLQLKILISNEIQETPKEWDTQYFIDFFIPKTEIHPMIGIQLKPETFYKGKYNLITNIENKMNKFQNNFNALVYILIYKQSQNNKQDIEFINTETIKKIQNNIIQ